MINFYYKRNTLHFAAGWDMALTDRYCYRMAGPAREVGNDVMIPVFDLWRLYSPEMSAQIQGDEAVLIMDDRHVQVKAGSDIARLEGNPVHLTTACRMEKDLLYVPVGQIMGLCFRKTVRSTGDLYPDYISPEADEIYNPGGLRRSEETVVAVSEETDLAIDVGILRYIDLIRRGKAYGEQYGTYWMEGPKKVVPYILYIPTGYDPEKPSRLIVFLHGGSYNLGEKYAFHFAGNKLQKACEQYNSILLCTNACTMLNNYGNMPPHVREHGTPEEKAYYQWGDDSVMQAIALVREQYAIDERQIFLMGNSMGAGGTFYLPTVHPGFFRALSPGAGSLKIFPPEHLDRLKDVPIIYPAGTEDDFGFDNILYTRDLLVKIGAKVTMAIVGGGHHLDAWVDVIDDIFRFFDDCSKEA